MVAVPGHLGSRPRPGFTLQSPIRMLFSARPWAAAAFLLFSFGIGLFWFVTLVTLIATGLGLAITFLGFPILVFTMVLWTWGARAERWRIAAFFGISIRSPYRPLPPGPAFAPLNSAPDRSLWTAKQEMFRAGWRKIMALAADPAVWRDLAYLVLLFPIGIAEFVLVTVAVFVPMALLMTAPLHLWGGAGWSGAFPSNRADALGHVVIGLPLLLLMPYLMVGVAKGHVALARALLGPTHNAQLEARVDTLTESRSRVVDAALAERRRIERDLHDGAQQRLVALAMELGMAKIKMDSDPEAARRLVDEAHQEAKLALVEIRNLVRGIYPAVLTDRGLDAAISALAVRCPVPVAVMVDLDGRLPEAVESTAYFVVAEALTNVARHSVATEAAVHLRRQGAMLFVEVSDNGLGGADPATGTGLTGLADRVAALDGRLTVQSPKGGPTRIRAEIPIGRQ